MECVGIYGAGSNGVALLKEIGAARVSFFIDRDEHKSGTTMYGKRILDLPEGIARAQAEKIRLIVSVENIKICEALQQEFPAVTFIHLSQYLAEAPVAQSRIERVREDYLHDFSLRDGVFLRKAIDSFRQEYYNEFNCALCEAMERYPERLADLFAQNEHEVEKEMLASPMFARDADGMYPDEHYENRFSMQLIHGLLRGFTGKVLEIGCGHGALLQHLKQDGMDVYGTDLDRERIRFLKEKGIPCYLCDAAETPFPDHSMEVVICSELLEHVSDPQRVVQEIRRVLKEDGRVYCSVPYMRHCDCHEHVRFFSESDLWTLFAREGFAGENIIRIPYIHTAFTMSIFLGARLPMINR